MNSDQRKKIKLLFENGKYDNVIYIIDNDLIKINLSNYESICDQILYILSEVRINRLIEIQEQFYPYEELFANDFHRSICKAIKRNEKIDELTKEVEEKMKNYYLAIKNIGSYMFYLDGDKCNEKTK